MKNKGGLLTSVTKGFIHVIPHKVLAKLGFTETKQKNPTPNGPDNLSATIIESKVEQNETDERNKTTTELGGASASFSGRQITQDLQIAVVTEEFNDLGSLSLSPDAKTVSGSIEDLGDGKGFKQQVDAPAVLSLFEYTAERHRLLPDVFFVAVADTIVETTSEGMASAPTLTGEQLRVTDHQIDAFKHRVSTKTGGTVADNVSFTSKEWTDQYGGAIVDHVQTKRAVNTLTVDFRTVSARADALGDGKFLVDERKLPSGDWPILTEDLWDELAVAFVHITKQVVAQGATTAGFALGVLTEVRAIDDVHELKITSHYTSAPEDQSLPILVEVSTPNWFTTEPTVIPASSGYTADQGESYEVQSKHGHFAAVLVRKFSSTIPTMPAGTPLTFTPTASQTDTAYENSGTEPYCRILRFNVPEHIDGEPVGDFLVSVQTHFHRCGWVQEYIVVTI